MAIKKVLKGATNLTTKQISDLQKSNPAQQLSLNPTPLPVYKVVNGVAYHETSFTANGTGEDLPKDTLLIVGGTRIKVTSISFSWLIESGTADKIALIPEIYNPINATFDFQAGIDTDETNNNKGHFVVPCSIICETGALLRVSKFFTNAVNCVVRYYVAFNYENLVNN
jgi:hypothetical protein